MQHKTHHYILFCSCIDTIYVSVGPSTLPEAIYCTERVPCNTPGMRWHPPPPPPRTRVESVPSSRLVTTGDTIVRGVYVG